MELTSLHDGRFIWVHDQDKCVGDNCCIHAPSEHRLNSAPLHWRGDRRIMERICIHGVGHPDPDDIKVQSSWAEAVHGCCGCC